MASQPPIRHTFSDLGRQCGKIASGKRDSPLGNAVADACSYFRQKVDDAGRLSYNTCSYLRQKVDDSGRLSATPSSGERRYWASEEEETPRSGERSYPEKVALPMAVQPTCRKSLAKPPEPLGTANLAG